MIRLAKIFVIPALTMTISCWVISYFRATLPSAHWAQEPLVFTFVIILFASVIFFLISLGQYFDD